jgi:uncharacterized protein YdhG (YjbR/CyaY superfamily)
MNPKVKAYIAAIPPAPRKEFKKLRDTILAAVPRAEEHFSYVIPAAKLDGKILVWFAAWKKHISIYPMTGDIKRRFAKELEGYKVSKGTIQFPLTEPIPLTLVEKLVKARAAEMRAQSTR